jgi:iron complex outermembrane receptor protein
MTKPRPGRSFCPFLSIARRIFAGALCIGATAALTAADATPAAKSKDIVSLQNFVVTGSNIQRLDMEKVVPITVIDQDAMAARQALLPVDMLTSLPSVVNLPENETRLGSSGARGDNANINLRNLGATGTLILVNGRRMAINPMTAGLSQAVNVNQLPTQGIERIEVLRDGASAIYGSDAVGGVINYVLKRSFQGTEVMLRFGFTEGGGGQSVHGHAHLRHQFRGQPRSASSAPSRPSTSRCDFPDATAISAPRRALTVAAAPAPFNALGGPFDARTARGLLADLPHRHRHREQLVPPRCRHAHAHHRRADAPPTRNSFSISTSSAWPRRACAACEFVLLRRVLI